MAALLVATPLLAAPAGAGASGHAPRRVPNVVGLTRSGVFAAMRGAGLYFTTRGPGSTTSTWSSAVSEIPRAGTVVAWHSSVTITVSRATGHSRRRVPRLVGRTRAQVYAAMRRAQLYFTTSGPGSATGTWVVATRQRPGAGTLVAWHSSVALTVSTSRRVVHHPTTTTTKPHHPTTTTTSPPATTTSTTSTTTTYPGETTTTGASTTTSTTTTIVKVTTTTVKKKKKVVPHRYRVGVATWYSYIPGRCATSYLPFGTRIRVRDLATGKTITCVVSDREGAGSNRVVDLSETQFAELAPLWRGVVRVKVSW
ncbi:MAG: PASTA domain-containing protein [Acidimicrobiales bacterium]